MRGKDDLKIPLLGAWCRSAWVIQPHRPSSSLSHARSISISGASAICQAKGDSSHDGFFGFDDLTFKPDFSEEALQDRDDVAPVPDEAHEDLLVFANELLYTDPTFYRKTLSDRYNQSPPLVGYWFPRWGEDKEDNVDAEKKCRSDSAHFDPSKVEFLGNGGCSPGRWYSRAALVLWPKQHRKLVRDTTYGAFREAQDIEDCERAADRKGKWLAGVAGAVV
jgi:hypothetical protein